MAKRKHKPEPEGADKFERMGKDYLGVTTLYYGEGLFGGDRFTICLFAPSETDLARAWEAFSFEKINWIKVKPARLSKIKLARLVRSDK